jgi:hypothetical protein
MASLEKSLRNQLERAVKEARDIAEAGAKAALETLGVGDAGPPSYLDDAQRNLRRRLRIHGRQLGDLPDEKKKTQEIERLTEEVAYEHWHRMLFARFLAENNLLMYPDPHSPVAVSLAECEDLASDEGARNGWELAARFAARMLPQIFRVDSPVFELELPPEVQQQLEKLISELPVDVFTASDSLGWVYQFWQARRKEQVNESEVKIGARELPAVTQLFTEDYMVDFLLDNTLGAWWAGKILASTPTLAGTAKSEEELRDAAALPGCLWSYLRFIREPAALDADSDDATPDEDSFGTDDEHSALWRPAAGSFDGWPKTAKELKCLDPCMGSGHFVVAMFERLAALRMAEEQLDEAEAVASVICDNLFGLEIDPRCTQIAAFNLALAAWRRTGYSILPPLNLACSGLAPNTTKEEWLALAGDDEKVQNGMERLFDLFEKAPILGSLINPRKNKEDLLEAAFHELQPLLEKALAKDTVDDSTHEIAVTARGIAKAAEILAGQFSLVATNVPYLGRAKQDLVLQQHCGSHYSDAKAELATTFVQRCIDFAAHGGSATSVTPQTWLFLATYKRLRKRLLTNESWSVVAGLGPNAFQDMNYWAATTSLQTITRCSPTGDSRIAMIDTSKRKQQEEKAAMLRGQLECPLVIIDQIVQLKGPDSRINFDLASITALNRLKQYASCHNGMVSGDYPRFGRNFWELRSISGGWAFQQSSVRETTPYGGMENVLFWENGEGSFREFLNERLGENGVYAWLRGTDAWSKAGVVVRGMRHLPASIYTGVLFDNNVSVIIPKDGATLASLWAYVTDPQYAVEVRSINSKVSVTDTSFIDVPFDKERWQLVADEKFANGLPKPFSSDPTQWLFNGHPHGSDNPLQVAVARLVGYQWPRQTGSSFSDCPALGPDGLEELADKDGIVCIPPVRGEAGAADRLLNLLAAAYGSDWNTDVLSGLLSDAGYAGKSLETWLRDGFFAQHVDLFQKRPFIWHIWDGLQDGFSALVNYHKLDRKLLDNLTHNYLGDWINRCQLSDKDNGLTEDGEKTTAAKNLKRKLEQILEGEAPYDIFVRWKPLHEQPIGWEPDLNDGVRMNIRPFLSVPDVKVKGAGILRVNPKIKWDKDRGKEPQRSKEDFPWFWGWDGKTTDFPGGPEFKGERFNDCHYTLARKRKAREVANDDNKTT